jgi:hypothetical protein
MTRTKQRRMFMDQYGNKFFASTVKELRSQIGMGGSRVSIMYMDKKDGATVRCGYVIGPHWLTEYAPIETEITS